MAKENSAKKSSVNVKSVLKVIIPVILFIAFSVGVAIGLNVILSPKEPVYTMQINEETGREEYYDEDGNLVYSITKSYSDEQKNILNEEIYCDEKNNTIKHVHYNADGKTVSRVDEYENERIIITRNYKDGEDTGEYTALTYNDDGKPLTETKYDGDDNVIEKIERKYNEFDKDELYVVKDKDGNVTDKTEYFYDEEGNPTKTVFYKDGSETGYVDYKYNDKGQMERMNQYEKGQLVSYRLFEYDDNGNCVKDEFHEAKDDVKK